MIFAAHIADDTPALWREAVARHAAWLGLTVCEDTLALTGGRTACFAWLGPASLVDAQPREEPHSGALVLTTAGESTRLADVRTADALRRLLADPTKPAAIRIGILPASGEVLAAVPPAAVEQLYFARIGRGWALSNDLRLMARLAGDDLDEAGVLGLFRYGLTPAPLTLFRRIRRVPVGHLLRIAPVAEPALERFAVLGDPSHREPATDAQTLIRDTLDEIVGRAPASPVVYFSGGVDSSLIAARLAALGRADAVLVNCAFGPDDPKAQLARRIAQHLGLRLHELAWNPADIPAVVERLGRDYPFPFCDTALVPGNLLVHAALPLARSSRTTLHGVGAGALFGQRLHVRRLWRPLGWLPAPARRALAWPYAGLRLWRRDSRAVRLFAVLRRSARVPIVHAMMTEHALEGIAYLMPPETGRMLDGAVRDYVEPLSASSEYDLLTSVLHQMYFTSREFSAVVLGPQMAAGVESVAPFMEPLMMRRGFALTWDEKRPGGVPKGLLRNLLAESVPPDLAQAAGGSFLAPHAEIYAHPAMRALVEDVVLRADNPLLGYCRADVAHGMLRRLLRGESLSPDARKFAWTLVFASAWLAQTRG